MTYYYAMPSTKAERKRELEEELAKKDAMEKIGDVNWNDIYYKGGWIEGVHFPSGTTCFVFDNLHDKYRIEISILLRTYFGLATPEVLLESVRAFRKDAGELG